MSHFAPGLYVRFGDVYVKTPPYRATNDIIVFFNRIEYSYKRKNKVQKKILFV